MEQRISRRKMLGATSAGIAGFTIVPRYVLGGAGQTPPSEKPVLAGVGVGGVGAGQLRGCADAGFHIAALCDVDDVYAKKSFDRWPEARRYRDFREMFQAEGDRIDAVYCGTPDHTHAVITMEALRRKKHVCCVKPLTRTIDECRRIVAAAHEAQVATQVTARPNTSESACRECELIRAGVIGPVREVHVWSNRPLWPQGMLRPEGSDPLPESLDWDLWLGPAPERPFKAKWPNGHLAWEQINANQGKNRQSGGTASPAGAVYHPWNFRGWWDFGTGALGDMGCHHLNTPYRALKLTYPIRIHATSTRVFDESAPLASIVAYDYAERDGMPPVRVIWYDGGLQPPCPLELSGGEMPQEGVLYLGEKGKMLGSRPLTETARQQAADVPRTLERRGGIWQEWIGACRGGEPAGCNFQWAGPLTEFVLLGNIALRTGQVLEFDENAHKFTNSEEANQLLAEEYRSGWTL
jgi:predicted dehydrogenase